MSSFFMVHCVHAVIVSRRNDRRPISAGIRSLYFLMGLFDSSSDSVSKKPGLQLRAQSTTPTLTLGLIV